MTLSEAISAISERKAAAPNLQPKLPPPVLTSNPDGSVTYQNRHRRFLFDADVANLLRNLSIHFSNGYGAIAIRRRKIMYIHRLITNCPEGEVVDHINGDITDNRRCNLRICSRADNVRSRVSLNKNNRSGHRGVWWSDRFQRWQAVVKFNRINRRIGLFITKEEAVAAASAARTRLFGKFKGKD